MGDECVGGCAGATNTAPEARGKWVPRVLKYERLDLQQGLQRHHKLRVLSPAGLILPFDVPFSFSLLYPK